MRFFLFFAAVIVVSLGIVRSDLRADTAPDRCNNAQSTADSMACVKQRYDEALEQLNAAFERTTQGQAVEFTDSVRAAHNDWMSYRDKECHWETGLVENESLRRLEELSCLTVLTKQRIKILENALSKQQGGDIREYGTFPRWMNVVADEYPDIYWRYGNHLNIDLDCDGQDEEIMPGQQVMHKPVRLEGSAAYDLYPVLAIADNAMTGRPQVTLLPLPLSSDGEMCDLNITAHILETPPQSNNEAGACPRRLKIEGQACSSLLLFWNGSTYEFFPPQNE